MGNPDVGLSSGDNDEAGCSDARRRVVEMVMTAMKVVKRWIVVDVDQKGDDQKCRW